MNGFIEKSEHDQKRATDLLSPHGIELAGFTDDTLIAAYVIDPTRSKYELTDLARETVGAESGGPPYDGWSGTGWRTAEVGDFSAPGVRLLRQPIGEKNFGPIYRENEIAPGPLLFPKGKAGVSVVVKGA